MRLRRILALWSALFGLGVVLNAQTQPAAGTAQRVTGTVKTIAGNVITIHPDTGADVNVVISDSSRLLQVASGQKDLKDATVIHVQDVQAGDRMLVRGQASDDGKSFVATSAIVMKAADISAKQEKEQEDWRKRGIGGLVSAVDTGAGTVTISTGGFGSTKAVKVITAKTTVIRRYSPDSVKFDDAKPSALSEIKVGDQLRARGNRNADGTEFSAEEIVSGTFRNIAGTVASTDAASQSLTVMDLVSKQSVTLKIDGDSQLHRLPATVAQRIAARLKGGAPPSGAPGAAAPNAAPQGGSSAGAPEGQRAGGTPDFQQILARMPAVALADLQKGDAVMIVSTVGGADHRPTAITLLTGVEPILTASPNGGQAAMLLSPWNLGGIGGGDAGAGSNP